MSQVNRQDLSEATTQWLIAKGYNPGDLNQAGENGDTALMKATREGVDPVVKELIDAGVDINARNSDRNNALWFACFGNHYDLINLLLAVNINIDNQNDNGATVLMYAASSGKTEVVKLLLPHHPNLDLKNLDDYKAIDFASNVEVLRILKDATK
ncbi:ankyrin repeat domain-containing protein [Nostoc sp.]|uniref:ankyrin repeat domain-containing protein n=1 Tax=Nostoc sp. TaxID=1180 RepID=UPI002FF7F8F1